MWRFWKYICLKTSFFLVLIFFTQYLSAQKVDNEAFELLVKVDSNLRVSNAIHFKATLFARMKDGEYHQKAEFKIQRKPLKIYYKQFIGNNIELLYDETKDEEKALINPDGFPYTNLRLSPYSPLILKRQHHSIFEADPIYSTSQLIYMFNQCKPDKCYLTIVDTVIQKKAFKWLKYYNPEYKVLEKKAESDMNIISFAKKHKVNFYSLVCLNDGFDSSTIINQGDVVKIPSSYAKKLDILIDMKKYEVNVVSVYDGKGLFEKMVYTWFNNEAVFKNIDFDKDNKNYNF